MSTTEAELLERITVREGTMGGKPTIGGMCFRVQDALEPLYSGMTWDEILEEHPALERDDTRAALLYDSVLVGGNKIAQNAATV